MVERIVGEFTNDEVILNEGWKRPREEPKERAGLPNLREFLCIC